MTATTTTAHITARTITTTEIDSATATHMDTGITITIHLNINTHQTLRKADLNLVTQIQMADVSMVE